MDWTRRHFLESAGLGGMSLLTAPLWMACGGDANSPGWGGPSHLDDLPPQDGRWWLRGNYHPVPDELNAFDLDVEGSLPPELDGLVLRNGPNPTGGASDHWLFGDGMVHGVRLAGGRALWYRNRSIRTKAFLGEAESSLAANRANTALVHHGGKLLALYEAALPTELSLPDLGTVGEWDFGGALRRPMSAHPKIDPATGELCFVSYFFFPPYLTYHVVAPDGGSMRTIEVPVERPAMMHDFQLTPRYVVLIDLPVLFDLERMQTTGTPFRWTPEVGARIGLLRRDAPDASDVRWFDVDTCFVFHTFNAYEDADGAVVLEGCRMPSIWEEGDIDHIPDPGVPWRWTLSPDTGRCTESQLDDRGADFATIDARRRGREHRYNYSLWMEPGGENRPVTPVGLIRRDRARRQDEVWATPSTWQPDEPLFVPATSDAEEGAGWLLSMVYDRARNGSSLAVLDATRPSAGPVALVHMPRRVPFGFHGLWVPGDQLTG